ncbi:signal peptidase I SipW [Salimicrobium halophilum]|uniref:Signal peptidase I n=1 Tax=Salimicrobium halophilum TaxID=86666 RepID=A0A1G8S838_9BACI|nr:signal peptidase I [Salimicrobium halophilum]SDJ25418.1 Signal peptidase I Serine peptidase. MEROPS family S26B [Salimicrobium halophilum]
MKNKRIRKILSIGVNTVLYTALVIAILLVATAKFSGGEPNVMGYQLKTVLSGSMEPEFMTGSVIAVNPDVDVKSFEAGDVITFMKDADTLVTHRIIDVTNSGDNVLYTTKGDNNDGPDTEPVLAENVVGEYTGFTVPYLGKLIDFANSPTGAIVFLIIPGALMIFYSAFSIWRALSTFVDEKEKEKANVH